MRIDYDASGEEIESYDVFSSASKTVQTVRPYFVEQDARHARLVSDTQQSAEGSTPAVDGRHNSPGDFEALGGQERISGEEGDGTRDVANWREDETDSRDDMGSSGCDEDERGGADEDDATSEEGTIKSSEDDSNSVARISHRYGDGDAGEGGTRKVANCEDERETLDAEGITDDVKR